MAKLCLVLLVVFFANFHLCLSKETIAKGPNPQGIKTPTSTFRNRFPVHHKTAPKDKKSKDSPPQGSVKILEALSRTANANVLKRNSSSHNRNQKDVDVTKSDTSEFSKRMGSFETFEESGENSYHPQELPYSYTYPSPQLIPVYSSTSKPPSYPSYGWGSNYYQPGVINYKPGQGTVPSVVFPPVPITTSEPQVSSFPPEPVGPPTPTSPSGTLVPVIGGGGSGGDTDEDEDVAPPAPPEDIFPPSPPEIESVGRMLPLKSNPPVRTRISNVGSSRERESAKRTSVVSNPGTSRVRSRLRDKVRESMEVDDDVPALSQDVITDFKFSDIKCLKTNNREYFGATIHMNNMEQGYHPPYIRDRPQDTLTSKECRMDSVIGSPNAFHMTVTDLRGCGVKQCGDRMCLTIVFPRVPTLALADDEVTTIECSPQQPTMADTRTISFAGDSLDNRKSSSTVQGGSQDFATDAGVFRKHPGTGLFTKRVNSGGVVQLGEPLHLRSVVGGDGWKDSKLSDVKVWRMRDAGGNLDTLDPNDATEVITLVDEHGCRNDEYQVIADKHPFKDPTNALVHHFPFKAFLFRGQSGSEPLILTAKVHACQEVADCVPRNCNSVRSRRSPVEVTNSSSIIHDWDSRYALRVIGYNHSLPDDFETEYNQGRSLDSPMTCNEKMAVATLGGGLIVFFLSGIVLALFVYIRRGKSQNDKPNFHSFPTILENQNQTRLTKHSITPRGHQNFICPSKPLPPPPPQHQPQPQPQNQPQESEKLSKSEIVNVAKFLQDFADNGQSPPNQEYESIEDISSVRSLKKNLERKKSDGVYVVYIDKKKSNRPKSAPPSLRKSKSSSRKKAVEVFDSNSESQSNTEATEESESNDTSDSTSNRKCIGFSGRKTVRNVKSRSNQRNNSDRYKVVSGIRRRLSNLYKDKDGGQFKGLGTNANKSSFPRHKRSGRANETYSGQLSSDLDSAYCGSEFNDDVLYEMRQLATKHRNSKMHKKKEDPENQARQLKNLVKSPNSYSQDLNNNDRGSKVKMQLRSGNRPSDKELGLGQTKAAHFVTRNKTSTQILIVPETHV